MIITEAFLSEQRACTGGMKWFREFQGDNDHAAIINGLITDDKHDYANWLIVRLMTHEQNVRYAIYAAEQVLELYEKKYPEDNRPRTAIQAAKDYLDGKITAADAADVAAYAAYAAAYAAYAAVDAAYDRKEMKTKILRYGLTLIAEA